MAFRSKVTATGRYRLGPGTLYDNLRKLLDRGIVEEPSPRASVEDHDLASASRESREFCLNFTKARYLASNEPQATSTARTSFC